MKKWLGFVLSFSLAIGSVGLFSSPANAAQTCTGFAVGNGSYAAPYEIANQADWQLFQACVLTADNGARYITFKQTGDFSVATLGNAAAAGRFGGYYDGNGHTITGIALTEATGLFAELQGPGSITNLDIEGFATSSSRVGALVGYAFDNGRVDNVHSRVTVTSPGSAVGGLIGSMNNASVSNSSASPAAGQTDLVVSSAHSTTVQGIGGLVGETFNATISNSYSTGRVNVGDSPTNFVGGLVGSIHSQYHQISASYSASDVYAPNSTYVGGLVGQLNGGSSSIRNSYATGNVTGLDIVGGLVGRAISTTTVATSYASGRVLALGVGAVAGGFIATSTGASTMYASTYWDSASPNLATSFGQSVGISGSQWSATATFAGWYISATGLPGYTWQICPSQPNSKPFLGWQENDCVYPPSAPSTPNFSLVSVGDGTVSFTIGAPSFLGHSPITGYFIERSSDNITWAPDTNPSTALSRTISGLTNGQTNYFRLIAKNISFSSPASYAIPATAWHLPSGDDHAFKPLAVGDVQGNWAKGFTKFGDRVYFQANDGVHGAELWSWDEVGEPELVADLVPGAQSGYPAEFTVGGGYLFFEATNGTSKSIYKFDGTAAPTRISLTNNPSVNFWVPSQITFLDGRLYFAAYSNNQPNYFSLGVSENLAIPVVCSGGRTSNFNVQSSLYLGSKIYFSGTDVAGSQELFVNDGTTCSQVHDLGNNSQVTNLATHGSKLYFSAAAPAGDSEMWIYDGVSAPTMINIDGDSMNASSPEFSSSESKNREVQTFGGKILFSASSQTRGRELMSLDANGTIALVSDFYPGSGGGAQTMGATFDGAYYFGCLDVALESELCRLDSSGQVTLFQDFAPGSETSYPWEFLATEKHLLLSTTSWQPQGGAHYLTTRAAHATQVGGGTTSSAQTGTTGVAPKLPNFSNLGGMKINPAGGVLKFSGSGFANIKSMKIGDRLVNITKTGDTGIEISYQLLTPGLNDLVLETDEGLMILLDALFVNRASVKRPAAKSVTCLAGYTSYFSEAAAVDRASLLCRRLKAAKPNLIVEVAVRKWPKATLRAVYDTSR